MTAAANSGAADRRVPCYRRCPVTFTGGEGPWLFDDAGRRYLDFLTGIGVNALGHGHPRLVAALADQAGKVVHVSNLYDHPLQQELAARLADACGLDLAFFCNSGSEAVEAGIKVARVFQHGRGAGERPGILALEGSFHGRSLGALSCTWEPSYRAPFEPLLPGVDFVPPEDIPALEKALASRRHAVLLVEPIQGESGVLPLSDEYLEATRSMTEGTGTLLLFDEIQSGGGRTGSFLASEAAGVRADIVTLAKPIGGGLPLGAVLARGDVGRTLGPGLHGSTFGGGPLACRAGLVFLDELYGRGLLARVAELGDRLAAGLAALVAEHGCCESSRGRGLMQGLVLSVPAAPVAAALLGRGLLVNATAGHVLRFLPPFILADGELAEGLRLLDEELSEHD